jgi:predicted PurR-regulated permease PerM
MNGPPQPAPVPDPVPAVSADDTASPGAVPEPAARGRERRALGFLALLALAFLVRLAMPVGVGLFLGALLAFTLEPLYARLRRQQIAAGPSALLCALGASLAVSALVLATTTLLVSRGVVLLGTAQTLVGSGGALRTSFEGAAARLSAFHINVADLSAKIEDAVLSLGSRLAGIAAAVASLTFTALLTLFFMTMAAYFVLRRWREIVTRAEQLLPFERRHTHALLDQFRTVGRQVLLGTVVTGLVQGVLAAFGYWITGVREPAFFGAITAVASLIPGVGTMLVWGTVGGVLLMTGHPAAGIAELTYGVLVVGIVSDYVIRPRLVGREEGVPAILVFVALFGGVEVFGVIGLILGPVIATLSVAIITTYAHEVAGVYHEDT